MGAIIRSRGIITNLNEKTTNNLNLENRKNMREPKLKEGMKKINRKRYHLKKMWEFYAKSYDKQHSIQIEETGFAGIGKKFSNETKRKKLN